MNAKRPKQVAAVVAAVLQHVTEVETPAAAPSGPAAMIASAFAGPLPLWGWAGRQDAMLHRTLVQRRLSKTW